MTCAVEPYTIDESKLDFLEELKMKDFEFEVKDALQDMFYSMAERMDKDHAWSSKELEDMGDIVFSDDRHRLSDYVDRLVKLTAQEDLKKDIFWRVSDIRETLLNSRSCDEWSVAVVNLNALLKLVDVNAV